MNKFSELELEKKTVKELRVIAKEYEIVGRHDMRKAELIKAIDEAQGFEKEIKDCLIENGTFKAISDNASRKRYIESAKVGFIIAFKVNENRVLSGKIAEIYKDKFVVETKTKVKFMVKKKNVLWVKTGARWPKGIYAALKGGLLTDGNGHKESNPRI
jgi:transcription termination factor Rho